MILKELNLIGFGKYGNKTINLKNGLNLIYGENESGKTTIHSFIDGMFYGFLRPYVKSTLYKEEHSKYQPWNLQRYAGIIHFYHNGELYRIERDFTKGKEVTRVLVESTGEDITYSIDCGNNGKVLQPGVHFFGFNNVTFSNTVSIKQLGSRTDEKLADEVRDKLVNVTTTLEDDISIEKAIKDLDKSLKDIGTVKAHTSLYGSTNAKTLGLEEQLQDTLIKKEEYESILEEDRCLKIQLMKLQSQLELQNLELKKSQYFEKKNLYNEALAINNYIDDKELTLLSLQKSKGLSNNFEFSTIATDYNYFEKMDEDKSKLLYGQDSSVLEFLKIDQNTRKKQITQYSIFILIITILYIGLSYIFLKKSLGVLLLIQFFIPFLFFTYKKCKTKKKLIDKINMQIEEIRLEGDNRKRRIEEIEMEQEALLKKHKVDSKTNFRLIYEDGKQNIQNEKNISVDMDIKRELLNRILGNYKMDELLNYLEENKVLISEEVREIDKIKDEIEYLQQEVTLITLAKKGLEERLKMLTPKISNLADIKEELIRNKKLLEKLDQKRQSVQLAKSTIEDLSKEIHRQFAPEINKKVGSIIKGITANKYSMVRINSDLEIGVIENNTGELIKVNNLSGGTIDQLYLSLRFGVISSLKGDKLPLILDDCFTQYDDYRLKNILRYLVDISKDRQVILFSCQNREREMLEYMDVNFNLITLA